MEENRQEASKHIYDIVIIGGGFTGLSAGLYFTDCNIKNILILEARDRIGGRVCSDYISINNKQCLVDTGGAYIGYGQNKILKMAKRYNIKSYKVNQKGNMVFNFCGNLQKLNENEFNMNIIGNIFNLLDLNYINKQINKLSAKLDWNNREFIKKYDSITVKEWIKSIIPNNKNAQKLYESLCDGLYCLQSSQSSMLNILSDTNKMGNNIEAMIDSQNRKFIGGMHQIAVKMRNDINNHDINSNKIKYNHIVQYIEHTQDNDICTIRCRNGTEFYSKYVLCCIPISLYKTITFKPALSWQRQDICNGIKMGYVIKINVFYQTAFWREKNLSGITMNYGTDKVDEFPVDITLDDTKPDGTFPSILGLIIADKAIEMTLKYTKNKRREIILKQYSKLFDDKRAITECVGYIEKIWHNEEFSGGGYSGVPLMNVLSKSYFNHIYNPEGKLLYFACTELATKWPTFIDGAIQSGQKEANKIAMLLKEQEEEKDDTKINIAKFEEFEPDFECEVEPVNYQSHWIMNNLPNSRMVKNCGIIIIIIMIAIIGAVAFRN